MSWATVTSIIFLTSAIGDILIYFMVFANRAKMPYAPNPAAIGARELSAAEAETLGFVIDTEPTRATDD